MNEELSIKRVLSNFLYASRLMLRIYPAKYLLRAAITVGDGLVEFLLYTYIIRFIVNGLQEGRDFSSLLRDIVIMLVAVVFFAALKQVYWAMIDPVICKKSDVRFNKLMFTKSVEVDLADFENPDAYDLFNHAVTNGTDAINKTMEFGTDILNYGVKLVLTVWLFWTIDPWLFVFPIMAIFFTIINVKSEDLWLRYEKKEQHVDRQIDYVKRVFYLVDYAKEMRLSNIGNSMFRRFGEAVKEFTTMAKKEGPKKAWVGFFINFGIDGVAGLGAELYALYRFLVSKTMLLGDCLVVIRSTQDLSTAAMMFGRSFLDIYDIALHIQDYRLFMEKTPKIKSGADVEIPNGCELVLHNVSFRYEGAENESLCNISMTVHHGEKIAIVGANGSGKTTLVKLMLRLYDVTEGMISLGGVDIKDFDLRSYRFRYGVMFQDYHQLSISVAENVLGRPYTEQDQDKVEMALKKAGIWEVVRTLPKGIHTVLGREFDKDGAAFSQGQSQKLAIAAIYASDCNTVILDEPSSALDPIAEQELFEELYRACDGKTMIFISHRMSSVVSADHIYVLKDGRLVEDGTHKELMNENGTYAEMFNKQAEYYISGKESGTSDE